MHRDILMIHQAVVGISKFENKLEKFENKNLIETLVKKKYTFA